MDANLWPARYMLPVSMGDAVRAFFKNRFLCYILEVLNSRSLC